MHFSHRKELNLSKSRRGSSALWQRSTTSSAPSSLHFQCHHTYKSGLDLCWTSPSAYDFNVLCTTKDGLRIVVFKKLLNCTRNCKSGTFPSQSKSVLPVSTKGKTVNENGVWGSWEPRKSSAATLVHLWLTIINSNQCPHHSPCCLMDLLWQLCICKHESFYTWAA